MSSGSGTSQEALLATIRSQLGVDLEGGTEPGNFEWASGWNWELKMEFLREMGESEREASWRNWPYRDYGESDTPPSVK